MKRQQMKTGNRARPSSVYCVSSLTIVFLLLGIGLLVTYFLIDFNDVSDKEYSSLSFTARYSLDEMKSFAYKNSLTKNYKPSLYVKWNLSFNRIFEDSENRYEYLDLRLISIITLDLILPPTML